MLILGRGKIGQREVEGDVDVKCFILTKGGEQA